jgi:hypothetical protein
MISPVRLDPASLCLWFDLTPFKGGSESNDLFELFKAAALGPPDGVPSVLKAKPQLLDRGIRIASAVWHEKRHFLDLILTNYGAFRMRQFFEIYLNMPAVMRAAHTSHSTLFCPLEVYADEVRSQCLGLEEVPANLRLVGRSVLNRKRNLLADQIAFRSENGLMQVGGEAQFEALAFLSQTAAAQEFIGVDANLEMQKAIPDWQLTNTRYRWAETLGNSYGVVKPANELDAMPVTDVSLLCCFLVSSLMMRAWNQKDAQGTLDSSTPTRRILALFQGFAQFMQAGGELEFTPGGAWSFTNELTKRIFGRDVVKELMIDYEYEEGWCRSLEHQNLLPQAKKVIYEYHRLRGELISSFVQRPVAFVDSIYFSREILPSLSPTVGVFHPGGVYGEPPSGWIKVYWDQDKGMPNEKALWWWGAAYLLPAATDIRFKNQHEWLTVLSDLAGIAKLLINGRAHRSAPGPELIRAESLLIDQFGITPSFEPGFDLPEMYSQIRDFYALRGTQSLACDACKLEIPYPEGFLLSPWYFRQSSKLASVCVEALGGGQQGEHRFRKDWSPWAVCRRCYDLFKTVAPA